MPDMMKILEQLEHMLPKMKKAVKESYSDEEMEEYEEAPKKMKMPEDMDEMVPRRKRKKPY